jgi:hypothetical protein
MLDGKMAIYHFTDKCILSIHQKKYNSISEYNNLIGILNKIYLMHAMKKRQQKNKHINKNLDQICWRFVKKGIQCIYFSNRPPPLTQP